MRRRHLTGERLLVAGLLALMAAAIFPQAARSSVDAQHCRALFQLQRLRLRIERYRDAHQGRPPESLESLAAPAGGRASSTEADRADKAAIPAPPVGAWRYDRASGRVTLDHPEYWNY